MKYKFSDGGRDAHFKCGTLKKDRTNDCVIRGIALATEKSYIGVRDALFETAMNLGMMPNDEKVFEPYLESIGWVKEKPFRNINGRKYRLKDIKVNENINYIFRTSKHLTAVVKGVNMDLFKAYNWCANSFWIERGIL